MKAWLEPSIRGRPRNRTMDTKAHEGRSSNHARLARTSISKLGRRKPAKLIAWSDRAADPPSRALQFIGRNVESRKTYGCAEFEVTHRDFSTPLGMTAFVNESIARKYPRR